MNMIKSVSDAEGVVYKKLNGFYFVHSGGREVRCTLSRSLHETPAVGDRVIFHGTGDHDGQIVRVLPRRNQLSRRAAGARSHAFEQVLVANVDQVIPVFAAANPSPHWNLLDRILAAAESSAIPVRICITKLDLAENPARCLRRSRPLPQNTRCIGYPVHLVSVETHAGLDELRGALRGRVSVFVGKSGVGKTSLLNALQPGLGLRTGEVSTFTGKGKHTTSWLELVPLELGGAVLDSPGLREYGLWDVPADDLASLFPEMRAWLGKCRFGSSCQHDEEPGCAVRRAVMAGQISPRRYHSYLRLREDEALP